MIGLGSVPFSNISLLETKKIIKFAADCGINFIDTARIYNDSETKIGKALKEITHPCYLTSKTGKRTYSGVLEDVDLSLENLQVKHLDVFQLHSVDNEEDARKILYDRALEGLKEAQKKGKINFLGITGHYPEVLTPFIKTGFFDTVQFPYNLACPQAEKELFPIARKLDIGTIVMKPLAGGTLIPPTEIQKMIDKSEFITAVQALQFIISNENVNTVITGVKSPRELKENLQAGYYHLKLSAKEKKMLIEKTHVLDLDKDFCYGCGYCLPCPKDIRIPDIFRLQRYYLNYNLKEYAKEQFKVVKTKLLACDSCGLCEERCPHKIKILEKFKEAQKLLDA